MLSCVMACAAQHNHAMPSSRIPARGPQITAQVCHHYTILLHQIFQAPHPSTTRRSPTYHCCLSIKYIFKHCTTPFFASISGPLYHFCKGKRYMFAGVFLVKKNNPKQIYSLYIYIYINNCHNIQKNDK